MSQHAGTDVHDGPPATLFQRRSRASRHEQPHFKAKKIEEHTFNTTHLGTRRNVVSEVRKGRIWMIKVLKPTKLVCQMRLQSRTQPRLNQTTKIPDSTYQSANWGQTIPEHFFYPSKIGHCWQIFAIIAIICLRKVLLLFAIFVPGQQPRPAGLKTLIIAINRKLLLQLFFYANNYLHHCND